MSTQETKTDLSEFFDACMDIPDKNRGGCLFFCYVFWLWLHLRGLDTSSFQIVQYDYKDSYRIEHNLSWISNEHFGSSPESSFHYTWMYEGVEYDSDSHEGYIDEHDEKYEERVVLHGLNHGYPLVEAFCIEALNNASWNDEFNRRYAIEVLEDHFDIDLSDILD